MFRKMFHEKHRQVVHYPLLWQYTSILLNFCNDSIECAYNRPIFGKRLSVFHTLCFTKNISCALYSSRTAAPLLARSRATPHAQPRHSSRDFLSISLTSRTSRAPCFTKNIARMICAQQKSRGNRGFIVLIILRNSSEQKQLTSCDACEQAGRAGSHSSDAPHAPSQPPSPSLPQC